ncbi:MAG: FCD domain-containing protein, partial [Polaromonas sp.]|nr:FCD domain-containing protein [Polaromonas sp.]
PHSAPEGRLLYQQRVNGEHENIYNAIRSQDAEAARAAMRTHLSNSRERLRKGQTLDASPGA